MPTKQKGADEYIYIYKSPVCVFVCEERVVVAIVIDNIIIIRFFCNLYIINIIIQDVVCKGKMRETTE